MKLATNFARPRLPVAQVLVGLSMLVLFASLLIVAIVSVDAHTRRDDTVRERVRLERLQQQAGSAPAVALPPPADVAALRARVAQLNRLSTRQGKSLPELLQRLENSLPDAAYLVHLGYKANGEIQLVAESAGAEALTAFLVKLQQDAAFAEAMLTRQSQRTANGQRRIQFVIRLREATMAAS